MDKQEKLQKKYDKDRQAYHKKGEELKNATGRARGGKKKGYNFSKRRMQESGKKLRESKK